MSLQGLDLFSLLPAVYRIRDAQLAQSQNLLTAAESAQLTALQALTPPLPADQQAELDLLLAKASRGPLQSLLMVIQEQLAVLAEDLDQLYDDQFIETCAPWVIPYIGDLIGYQSVKGIAPAVDNPRSEVAGTISFRRRKGTVLVMEQLARDATGWGAHAVEFFLLLGETQYMNHIRPYNYYAPDLRQWQPGLFMDTGFDSTAHKVDVRRIASRRGRYNIQNIGIFLWSLNAYSVTKSPVTVSAASPLCFRFSSLGMDIALFHKAVSQGLEVTAPAGPVNVPDRLRRRVLCADVQQGVGAQFYGEGNSLALYLNDQLLNPYQIQVCNLSGAEGSWANMPPANSAFLAAIDPELGRIALPPVKPGSNPPTVKVSYYYGFNANMGGGEYPRAQDSDGFIVNDPAWIFSFPDPRYPTLQQALDFAVAQLAHNGQVALEITDSQIYPQSGTLVLSVHLPAGKTLEFRAADGARPTLLLDGEITVTGAASSSFVLNGLLIAGNQAMSPGSPSPAALLHVPVFAPDGSLNQLGQLSVTHCTLVPGWSVTTQGVPRFGTSACLIAEPAGLQLAVKKSIVGVVRAGQLVITTAADSIIDATDRTNVAYAANPDGSIGGGALSLDGCTVIGKVHATLQSLVSNSIFWAEPTSAKDAPLLADRKQEGCVRFSYLPIQAVTPRQFECVQQGQQGLYTPQPLFFSLGYGHPGYAKLLSSTDNSIRRGADDSGEMGAFHFLLAPLREADLRVRVQEYLPVGMEFGVIYQN
ncbi:MAG TPA: hypothetical protein VI685_11895 [Candidatus Angelobacter sp.]